MIAALTSAVGIVSRYAGGMAAALVLRAAHTTALRVEPVALRTGPAILVLIVDRRTHLAAGTVPLVAAGTVAAREGIARDIDGMSAAIRLSGASEVTRGVRTIVPFGTAKAIVGGVVLDWAPTAGRTLPLIAASAVAIRKKAGYRGCVIRAVRGAGADPVAARIVVVPCRTAAAVVGGIVLRIARATRCRCPLIATAAGAARGRISPHL